MWLLELFCLANIAIVFATLKFFYVFSMVLFAAQYQYTSDGWTCQ